MTGVLAIILSYLLGSLPFGVWIGRLTKGIDIRDFGSGNIGASNVLRTLGVGPALLVFVLDTAKGWGAVALCGALGLNEYWVVACGLLCVLGHTFSVFLRFRGGKGVATSLGVIVGLNPIIAAVSLGIWIVFVATTRIISIASMIAAVSVPAQMILWRSMDVPALYTGLAVLATCAILARHVSNVKRILAGTEPRIGQMANTNRQDDKEQ